MVRRQTGWATRWVITVAVAAVPTIPLGPVGAAAQAPPAEPAPGIMAAADRLAASGASDEIEIAAGCWRDGPYRLVRLYGSGVGIWNMAAQFSMPRSTLESVLQAFRDADFEHMPPVFGGSDEPDDGVPGPRVICQVSLTAGDRKKEVIQRDRGTQSTPLWTLANAILDRAEAHAASAVTAASLEDGLAKIVSGDLAAESLRLAIHHRGTRVAGREPGGWILHLDGRTAIAETYGGTPDARQTRRLRLAPGEFSDLVRTLRAEGTAGLPANLYFSDYTDLTLSVLNREHQVQARQFSGLVPETQARERARFERLLAALASLHGQVVSKGQPAG